MSHRIGMPKRAQYDVRDNRFPGNIRPPDVAPASSHREPVPVHPAGAGALPAMGAMVGDRIRASTREVYAILAVGLLLAGGGATYILADYTAGVWITVGRVVGVGVLTAGTFLAGWVSPNGGKL